MDIKVELLKNYISDFIKFRIEDFKIDASQIAAQQPHRCYPKYKK